MRGQNVLAFRINTGTHISMDPVTVAVTTIRRVRGGNARADPDGHADAHSAGETAASKRAMGQNPPRSSRLILRAGKTRQKRFPAAKTAMSCPRRK